MKIIPSEPDVELYKDGFEGDDILDRASTGLALSNLVERIEDPMVVALEGGWGTGKTYFLKRWAGAHELSNGGTAKTVYFDAFASDYVTDPLPALVSAISERFPTGKKKPLKRLRTAAVAAMKPLARVSMSVATGGATTAVEGGLEAAAPLLESSAAAAVNAMGLEASAALNAYWAQEEGRSAAMKEFRSALEDIIGANNDEMGDGARLVIIIDELDRCRPDYALEVLEVIKHFFTIPRVVFVLGTNLAALKRSVKARHGGDIDDASAYLRKFINISLTLPSEIRQGHTTVDDILVYLDHQISEMGIPEHIASPLRAHVKIVSRNNSISVRDIGKILSSVSLLGGKILTPKSVALGWIVITITLLVSRIVRPDLYIKFLNADVNKEEIKEYFDVDRENDKMSHNDCFMQNFYNKKNNQYSIWMHITNNSKYLNTETNIYDFIHGWFVIDRHKYGYFDEEKMPTFPRIVHRDYINIFSMVRPDDDKR